MPTTGMSLTAARPRRAHLATRLSALPLRLFDALLAWQQRAAERRHLAALDDRLLKDMGLSRADVAQELEKPMWRA
ncbi:MAG: DUF1127 domain-containing protein [Rhodospirillaceae bacterium]|nr:DUF1127 domain-containing protein [Rhodospirillaceae bacterium]MCA8932760.1 DUF1127 domain-containing protein [Rhodospirillaceae bacterium]